MSAILEIPEVRRRVSHLTVEEYHRLDEFNENGKRTELIRGIIIEKTSKSPAHCYVIHSLREQLSRQLPDGFLILQHDPITLTDSEPEPDIAVVCGADADFTEAHPTTAALVIEVAFTTLALDRAGASMYAEAGVKEYWIVLGLEQQVEVYRRPVGGVYEERTMFRADETIECSSVPEVRVRVSELFAN